MNVLGMQVPEAVVAFVVVALAWAAVLWLGRRR